MQAGYTQQANDYRAPDTAMAVEPAESAKLPVSSGPLAVDLVAGTRVILQSLPAPLSGRVARVLNYDTTSRAYLVAVDCGNPRTIYRENLRLHPDQSLVIPTMKRPPGRPQTKGAVSVHTNVSSGALHDSLAHAIAGSPWGVSVDHGRGHGHAMPSAHSDTRVYGARERGYCLCPGDQVLVCIDNFQYCLFDVSGIRKLARAEPFSYALSLETDDASIPAWFKKLPTRDGSKNRLISAYMGATDLDSSSMAAVREKFRANIVVGDEVYAMYDDLRWYPGIIRDELGDKYAVEWVKKKETGAATDENAYPGQPKGPSEYQSVVRKNAVCRRTAFDRIRSKPNFLSVLNVAAKGSLLPPGGGDDAMDGDDDGGDGSIDDASGERIAAMMKGPIACPAVTPDIATRQIREEEDRVAASKSAMTALGISETSPTTAAPGAAAAVGELSTQSLADDDWACIQRAIRLLAARGVDGLIDSRRGQVFFLRDGSVGPNMEYVESQVADSASPKSTEKDASEDRARNSQKDQVAGSSSGSGSSSSEPQAPKPQVLPIDSKTGDSLPAPEPVSKHVFNFYPNQIHGMWPKIKSELVSLPGASPSSAGDQRDQKSLVAAGLLHPYSIIRAQSETEKALHGWVDSMKPEHGDAEKTSRSDPEKAARPDGSLSKQTKERGGQASRSLSSGDGSSGSAPGSGQKRDRLSRDAAEFFTALDNEQENEPSSSGPSSGSSGQQQAKRARTRGGKN